MQRSQRRKENATELLTSTRTPTPPSTRPPYLLTNHAITQVHQYEHISVILSSTLSWSPISLGSHLISRSSAMFGPLRHLHSYFHFLSRCLLKFLLHTCTPTSGVWLLIFYRFVCFVISYTSPLLPTTLL